MCMHEQEHPCINQRTTDRMNQQRVQESDELLSCIHHMCVCVSLVDSLVSSLGFVPIHVLQRTNTNKHTNAIAVRTYKMISLRFECTALQKRAIQRETDKPASTFNCRLYRQNEFTVGTRQLCMLVTLIFRNEQRFTNRLNNPFNETYLVRYPRLAAI